MDAKELKELVRFLDKTGFTEFEYEGEDFRIYLSKQINVVQNVPQTNFVPQAQSVVTYDTNKSLQVSMEEESPKEETDNFIEIKSPIVGTFYEAPAPGAEPFVREGDIVKKGKTLCIVEAMKIMNEIEAEFDCKIVKKLGLNGEPVEYGETIFLVEKV
jgi:acetyl-CoA carboxylase biotin carboxyl carrier protein